MSNPWLVLRLQRFPVSFRISVRVPPVLVALTLVTLAGIVINVGYGEYYIEPLSVLKTLLGIDTGDRDYSFIINTLRLPRVLVAFLAGIGLAVSGTILQGLTGNPLAAPEIIGVSAGASLSAVTVIVLLPSVPLFVLPLAAFGGALAVAVLIYLLAWDKGSSPLRLILIGVGISAFANALISVMVTFGEINSVSQALIWMTGSVYGRSWEHLDSLLPWLAVFVPLTLLFSGDLNALHLGDDVARSLGSRVELVRGLLLLFSVALAGSAIATAGNIGFVGLIAPHLARRLVGSACSGLLPTAALMGGCIVVLADLLGRSLFAPIELPCGAITATVGAPYFLYLLYRSQKDK